jgi:amino acid adenylation domain-containing protein
MSTADADRRDVNERLAKLGPAQRAILERRLLEQRATAAAAARIPRRAVLTPVPLAYSQELLWLLSQLESGVAYNAPAAFRLQGPIDAAALQRALDSLVERHEIFRTTYEIIDGRPMQIVASTGSVELRLVDLSTLPETERDVELRRILREDSEHEFDLRTEHVLRPWLIKLGNDDHVFFYVIHHIATDGYSRAVLHDDLTELYEAAVEGREPELSPLQIQYADFAVWHREWLEGGILDQQLAYWQETLAHAPSRLELPTDRPRPAVRLYQGNHTSRMFGMELRRGLESVAREGDGTLFMALLSAYAALLHRYSGQDDIVIGTPFAGRNRREIEAMIGYFINPLALRVDVSGDPSFRELLRRARESTLGAFSHGDVPYEMVVRATSPERDLSQTPVFQVMMVLHNPDWERRRPTFEPRGTTATELVYQKGFSKFDLLLGMSQRPNGLNTTWEYSTELFEPDTASRISAHFEKLVESIVADPDLPISKLPMLLDEERPLILSTWAGAPTAVPEAGIVKELFEEKAAAMPDNDAVVFGGARLSFGELNARSNRLAHRLRRLGVGPGMLVGIHLEKSLELVAAVLGVIKAGGAYIPLDPMYPEDRLEFMLDDARPAVLIANEQTSTALRPAAGTTVFSEWEELDSEPDDDPPTSAAPDDLAYVIYTSGSTGRPKGAMITNRSLASAFFAYDLAYRLTEETTSHLQMASFSFDVFIGDVVRSLLSGSKLVLCPLEVVMDPPRLYELMVAERIDCAEFVPATASLLFEHVERIGRTLDFMRVLVVSSEGWRTDKYAYFKRLCGSRTRLINAYGLTEATIDSTWFETDEELVGDRFVPIGRPLANSEVYLLDAYLQPVPTGIPGELCVGGMGVGLGYLNRPELTAERFVPNPLSSDPEARLYRTGDLARWLPDGNVEFLGRADRQLKIRGFRIEPGEIEAVLERHAAVRTAAVIAREDRPGDVRLVAYYERVEGHEAPSSAELRVLARESLPAYMVPSACVELAALPLTPNGKIDLAALPEPERTPADDQNVVEPRDEVEAGLAEIWKELLDLDGGLSVHDDFFALGGHSLLAVRLFTEIEKRFKAKLPLTTLFRGATIEQLAVAIRGGLEAPADWSTIIPIRTEGSKPPLFIIGGVDGEVIHYRGLVATIDPDQPLYGLQPAGLDGRSVPKTTIEEIAADYVRDLRAFRPEGDYLLAGYCFSGLVAYEVALQLYEQGSPAAMLALIDAAPSQPGPSRIELERQKFQDFLQRDWRGKLAWFRRRAWGLWYKIRTRSTWLTRDLFVRLRLPLPRPLRSVSQAGNRARLQYRSRPAPLKMILFRAAEVGRDWARPSQFWNELATGGVELVPLVAEGIRHDNVMKEPYVSALAEELTGAIEGALAAHPPAADQLPSAEEPSADGESPFQSPVGLTRRA